MGSKVSGKMAAASRVVQVNTRFCLYTECFAVTVRSYGCSVETMITYMLRIVFLISSVFTSPKRIDFPGLTDVLVGKPSIFSVYFFISYL